MSLNDLLSILTSPNGSLAQADTALAGRVIDGVVKALDDANGEVQNLAVKWYVTYHVLESYIRALFLAQLLYLLIHAICYGLYIYPPGFAWEFYRFQQANPGCFFIVLVL